MMEAGQPVSPEFEFTPDEMAELSQRLTEFINTLPAKQRMMMGVLMMTAMQQVDNEWHEQGVTPFPVDFDLCP